MQNDLRAAVPELGMVTVIITDDDEGFARMLRKCATSVGAKTVICTDGDALVLALQSSDEPAVVFLDIHMGDKDGIEVLNDLKLIPRRFRLRFMTGGTDTNAVAAHLIAKARDMSVGETLFKPFPLQVFCDAMVADAMMLARP